jgi:ribose/xylose/arabinose/galactoside ABC-type transport system permease subunit
MSLLGELTGVTLMQMMRTGLNFLGFPADWQPAARGC